MAKLISSFYHYYLTPAGLLNLIYTDRTFRCGIHVSHSLQLRIAAATFTDMPWFLNLVKCFNKVIVQNCLVFVVYFICRVSTPLVVGYSTGENSVPL